jgi:adenylate cyclase
MDVCAGPQGGAGVWQARRAERAEKVAAKFAGVTAPISSKSIAVLPFENLSEDREANAFFVDGMHEDVIAGLTRIPDLRCVPRPTVAAYRDARKPLRELAGDLQVAYVRTGSVRRGGQKVRLTATLVDARTAAPQWSRTYDRELADVFAIQAELAQAIAAELKAVNSAKGSRRYPLAAIDRRAE